MAGIVPTLKPHHKIGPFGQPINDLAFSFIAPLGADDHNIGHVKNPFMYRKKFFIFVSDFVPRKSSARFDFPQLNCIGLTNLRSLYGVLQPDFAETWPTMMVPNWMRNPHFLLTITALGWAGNAIAGKFAVGHVSPMALSLTRWVVAFTIIFILGHKYIRKDWQVLNQNWVYFLLMGGFGYTVFNFCMYSALIYTSAVNVTIEQTSMPLLIFAMNFVLYRTGITWLQMAGYFLTFVGVVITATHGQPFEWFATGSGSFNRGDIIMLIGALFYAGYSVGLRSKPDVHFISMLAALIAGGIVFAVFGVVYEGLRGGLQLPTTLQGMLTGLYAGIIPSLVSQGCFMIGVTALGANRAGLYINLVPVFAAILVILLLDEAVYLYHGVAFLLVVGGVLLSQRERQSAGSPAA